MFRKIDLKSTYSSYSCDLIKDFYNPVLSSSIKYDRATAYFSAKAIAKHSVGLESFAKNGKICRFIISTEISEEDYNEIKEGYHIKEKLSNDMIKMLREEINLEEEKNISNLAYLISMGVIEIKIAFVKRGIFHDKFGIMEDTSGDIICFRGSNNETLAAIESNFESFDLTCSWLASDFDRMKIIKSQNMFNKLWENEYANIVVLDMNDVVRKELLSFNKGSIVYDRFQLEDDCFILDYNNGLVLEIKSDPKVLHKIKVFKLNRFIDVEKSSNKYWYFKGNLGYIEFKKIITIFESDSNNRGYRFFVTDRLNKYIQDREFHINERYNLGISIKNKEASLLNEFNKYTKVVNEVLVRPLREKQLWDSFFMYVMQRSGNFSVPGSGKTASVLGTFAYLYKKGEVKRIVMVGPKNSFNSWIDEFDLCFGSSIKMNVFNIHKTRYNSKYLKKQAIEFETGNSNLILINYESLESYIDELKEIVKYKTLLVFDEIHKVKAIEGVRAKYALKLSEFAKYTVALTGTPIPNSYLDIKNFLNILYREEYGDFFGFSIADLKNPNEYKKIEINKKIQPFFCRTSKKELNVPDANKDIIIEVEATEEENRLFQILTTKYKMNPLILIIRLLQQESNPKMILEKVDLSAFNEILDTALDTTEIDFMDYSQDVFDLVDLIKSTSKMNACIDLATDLVQSDKKIIIWCIFIDSMNNIKEKLNNKNIIAECVNGGIGLDERDSILSRFKNGELDVLITNPHTLAESVSLHGVCHDAIYFEYSYNLVHLLQSKDRIHRLGLKSNQYTQYYFLHQFFENRNGLPYSLDEKIYERLQTKEKTMLEAIERNVLESGSTPEEDIDFIFKHLGL